MTWLYRILKTLFASAATLALAWAAVESERVQLTTPVVRDRNEKLLLMPQAGYQSRVQRGITGTVSGDRTIPISSAPVGGEPPQGSIVAWGHNAYGQCDVPEPNTGFTGVAAGGEYWGFGAHSLGLKADGSIVAWGWNGWGQTNIPAPNTGFVAVAAGANHSLGLNSNGSIMAWGYNFNGECNVPGPNADFVGVAAGTHHSLGLKADGSIVAWGTEGLGQTNVPAPNAGFTAAAGGANHSLGLKADGSIVAWGGNDSGELNVPAPNTGFVAVAAGFYHSLGLKADGSIVAWGRNVEGQCDVPAPNTGFVGLDAGWLHSLGLKGDGSIVAWGDNRYGQSDLPVPNRGFVAIAAGSSHNLSLKSQAATQGITGTVTDDRAMPIANASVSAHRPDGEWVAGAATDGIGEYSLSVPPGEYILDAWGPQGTYYTQQTYNGLSGNVWTRDNWQNATPITVAEGTTVDGIDFALGVGGGIHGYVHDADNAGLPGVSVSAYGLDSWYIQGTSTDDNGSYTFAALEPGTYYLDAQPYLVDVSCLSATTSYDGHTGAFNWYWCHGRQGELQTVIVQPRLDVGPVGFVLPGGGGGISGRVTESDGETPLGDVDVTVFDEDGCWVGATTAQADGAFTVCGLVSGQYITEATGRGESCYTPVTYDGLAGHFWYDDNWTYATRIEVLADTITGNIDFALPAGGTITGKVTEEDAITPIAGATITLYEPSGNWVASTETDGDGAYTVCGLPAGEYVLDAWGPEGTYLTQQTYSSLPGSLDTRNNRERATRVPVGEGEIVSDINFELPLGGRILGTVSLAGGGDVCAENVVVRVYDRDGWHIMGTGACEAGEAGDYALTLDTGEYYLDVQVDGDPSPDYCLVASVSYAGHAGAIYWYSCNGRLDELQTVGVLLEQDVLGIDFVMPVAGAVSGRVTESDGTTPIADADVNVYDENGCWVADRHTEPDGTYTVCGIPPGQYVADARSSENSCHTPVTYSGLAGGIGYDDNRANATRIAVQVDTVTGNIDFALPAGSTITGKVTEEDGITPIAGATVTVYEPNGNWVASRETDGDGAYTLCGLPAGEYILDAWGPEGLYFTQQTYAGLPGNLNTRDNWENAVRVVIPEGATVPHIDFTLGIGGRILGTALDSNQEAIANATVQAFDEEGFHIEGVGTDVSGRYVLTLDPGSYYLNVLAFGERNDCQLAPVTYDGHTGVFNMFFWCLEEQDTLQTVQVQPEQDVDGTDFHLPPGVSISGRVTESDGATPIANAQVVAWDDDETDCWFTDVRTRSDGTYIFCGAPAGQYVMEARSPEGAPYQAETYQNLTGWTWCDDNWANATRVVVEAGGSASDVNFSLDPPPTLSITVREPLGSPGSCFNAGDTITVDWTSDATNGDVNVYVVDDRGLGCWLGSAPVSDGTLTGRIAECLGGGVYVIYAQLNASCSWTAAESEELCITGSRPVGAFEVTQPAPGARLPAGSQQVIEWTAGDPCGEVYAFLGRAGGGFFYCYLGSAPMEQGQMSWTVPINVGDADDYKVLIEGYQDSCAIAVAESGPFSITDTPGLHLTFPNGNEKLTAGSTYEITWDPLPDTGESIGLMLKKGGEPQQCLIGTAEASEGSFPWAVSQFLQDGADYTIEICWLFSCGPFPPTGVCDESDGPFTINGGTPPFPTITVTSPSDGDTWRWGSEECITWTVEHPNPEALVGANVLVFAFQVGNGWVSVPVFDATVPLSDGHFCVELSCALEEGSNYVVGILLENYQCVEAQSDGAFSIGPALPDVDADGDVDLIDYAAFVDCADGPGVFPDPTPPMTGQDCLNAFDACGDGDIDLFDFGIVQRKFAASR